MEALVPQRTLLGLSEGEDMAKFLRLLLTLAGVALVLWLVRDRLVSVGQRIEDEPVSFRVSPPEHVAPPAALTTIEGIGPVYAERLAAAGIGDAAALRDAGVEAVATAAGVNSSRAASWVESAQA